VTYPPLLRDEIRLLTLLPPITTEVDGPIHCSLHSFSPSDHSQEYQKWVKNRDGQTPPHETLRLWKDHARKTVSQPDNQSKEPGQDLDFDPSWLRYSWGDYIALSYTWGSPERPKQIILNGHPVAVTANFDAALRNVLTIAQTRNSTGKLRVWADAVCIHQEDADEVSREIKRMRSIFAGALGVVVALGNDWEGGDAAFGLIRTMSFSISEGLTYLKLKEDADQYRIFKGSFKLMVKLMFHDYWRRVWVIQELAVGADPILIACGESRVHFEQWRTVYFFLQMEMANIQADGISPGLWGEQQTLNDGALLMRFDVLRSVSRSIEQRNTVTFIELAIAVLSLGIMGKATDLRDQIYGIMGLLPNHIVDKISVNYALTPGEVYVDFAKVFIEEFGLDILSLHSQTQQTKPSWVTDYTKRFDRLYTFYERGFPYTEHPPSSETVRKSLYGLDKRRLTCRADGHVKAPISFSETGTFSKLHCQGVCIGEVDGFSAEGVQMQAYISANHQQVTQPVTTANPYGNEQGLIRALFATLSQNLASNAASDTTALLNIPWCGAEADSDSENIQIILGEQFSKLMVQLVEQAPWTYPHLNVFGGFEMVRRLLGAFRVAGKPLKEYFVTPDAGRTLDLLSEASVADMSHMVTSLVGRRLAVLESGHLALIPAVGEKGDVVWVLYGASMPMLLRQCVDEGHGGDCKEVIGDCYVEGFMSGEGVAAVENGEYTREELTLC
jgi:hypothetical protein